MTHSIQSRKQRILSGRISLAGLGAVVAAASLMLGASAEAGTKEKNLLLSALQNAGATDLNATPAQLQAAVQAVITANPKLKAGVIAGEALKFTASIQNGAGDEIAQGALDAIGAGGDRVKLTGDAAKTASTSKNANPLQVPSFTVVAINTDAEAISAAELARASKTAVGAIIGGQSVGLSDAAALTLANTAIQDKKIAAAVTEISSFVTALTIDNPGSFAANLADLNAKVTAKIAPGVAAGSPQKAGDVVRALLNDTVAAKATALKAVTSIAKSVSAVADIEQISVVGMYISDQIGTGTLKTSIASGLAKTLTAAITKKANSQFQPQVNADNKGDEIAEVAAYIVGGLLKNTTLTEKSAPKLVLNIIKSAIAGGKTSKKTAQLAPNPNYIQDIVTSVALTIGNSQSALTAALKDYLQKNAAKIAGKNSATAVSQWLAQGFNEVGNTNTLFEDGNIRTLAQLVDPETDVRNF